METSKKGKGTIYETVRPSRIARLATPLVGDERVGYGFRAASPRFRMQKNEPPTPPWRKIFLIVAWAGFIWMIIAEAIGAPVSDVFLINLAYMVVWLAVVIVLIVAALSFVGRTFRPSLAVMFATMGALILLAAAIEIYWLRDWIAAAL